VTGRRCEGKGGRGNGWEGRGEGTGRGPQFEKNDPPVIRWLVTGLDQTTRNNLGMKYDTRRRSGSPSAL